ncbi:hypothetical protein [Dyadobacter sp. CY356]|uniref:glycine-rich domain-containing protein n=1 Tax=Dyadobacter sp. CY356 TaxID=2906442 RepID=UPI001F3CEB47|nr:hypothetical protein [Dyadobacter sp. CY356]MCF0057172.1 hypothetical protein [Dyadobacter sp. CY356]
MTAKEIIEKALSFPMDHVTERYARDNDISLDVAKEHEIELKRFLALCSINPHKSYGMAGVTDELWHTFIFHTKSYFEFCSSINGSYIHHTPEPSDEKSNLSPYVEMLKDYENVFGQASPKHIWPDIKNSNISGSACGTSCSRCGHGCSSCGHGCRGCTSCH